jgi:hypothetical protein
MAFRLEGARLVKIVDETVYELTPSSAAVLGAGLADLRLMLTVATWRDGFQVRGALVILGSTRAAPLVPRSIARRRPPSTGTVEPSVTAPADAGTDPDASEIPGAMGP